MEQITAATKCDSCGGYGELTFMHMGSPIKLGTDCAHCEDGMSMTIGYYGNVPGDPEFNTVLRIASEKDLREIAEAVRTLGLDRELSVEDVAQAVESVGTDLARQIAAWVRENGGWFNAVVGASTIAGLVVAVIALFAANNNAEPDAPLIQIEKLVVRDDGQVILPPAPDATE